MKTSSLQHRALIVCTLLIGVVTEVPAADSGLGSKASQFAPRVEKRAGFFSRLFGHGSRTSKRPDRDDDDDDDQRDRDDDDNQMHRQVPPLPEMPAPQGRTVVVTTTSTPRASTDPHYVDAHRIPLVQVPASSVAQPGPLAVAPSRLNSPRNVTSRATEPTEVRVESTTSTHPQAGVITVIPPAQPVRPAPLAATPKPVVGATEAASQLPAIAGVAKPASPPPPPFGKPVPGRAGMVYAPGLKETTENMLDVRDIAPGTKVRDPVTKTIFLVP